MNETPRPRSEPGSTGKPAARQFMADWLKDLSVSLLIVFLVPVQGGAAEWKLTSGPFGYATPPAISADGQTIVIAESVGLIHISTNAGSTWTSTGSPRTNWYVAACSADGTRIAAITGSEVAKLFLSTNCGSSWEVTVLPSGWRTGVDLSADGTQIVVAGGRALLVSPDFGASWTNYPAPAGIVHLAMSPDGTRLLVEAQGPLSSVYLSPDSGASWRAFDVTNDFPGGVAMSADGSTLVAASYSFYVGGPIFVSTNAGQTWQTADLPNDYWSSVSCSADGRTLAAVGGRVYVSYDAGSTWKLTDYYTGWTTYLGSSADGCRLIAASQTKGIWIRETVPQPRIEIRPAGGHLLLSWVVPSQPFVLQACDALAEGAWTDVPVAPVLNPTNLHHEVVVPVGDTRRFYRLTRR